jgi:hypothetical protein
VNGRSREWALALVGLGVGLVSIAFAVRPVHGSTLTFWFVTGAAVAFCVGGLVIGARPLVARRGGDSSRCSVAARECWRATDLIKSFNKETARMRPRGGFLNPNPDRVDEANARIADRYRDELRPYLTRVYAEAVELGAVSPMARPLVETPSPGQLDALHDLFADAAQRLDERAAA